MKLDMVGYRYSKSELPALMSLLGFRSIPCLPTVQFPDREQFREGIGTLEKGNIVENIGGTMFVEKLHALLISRLCECGDYLLITCGKKHAAVCVCRRICLLVQTIPNGWLLKAAPDVGSLWEELQSAWPCFPSGTKVHLVLDDKNHSSYEAVESLTGKQLSKEIELLKERFNRYEAYSKCSEICAN